MTYSPPGNPVKRQPARLRQFDGVSGPEDKVLRKTNEKGWELSNNIANLVEDLNLGRKGSMRLRLGSRKINDTGKASTIEAILPVRIAGNLAYGMVYGGTLEIVTMPKDLKSRMSVVDMVPRQTFAAIANESITTFPGEQL